MTSSPRRLIAEKVIELSYQSLVENIQDYAIFMVDKKGIITSWDQGARRQFGYSSKEVMGKNFSLLFTHTDAKKGVPRSDLIGALRYGRHLDEREYRRKNGTYFWSTGVLTSTIDKQHKNQGFSKVMRDITEQKNLQNTVLHTSNHDYLTGLPNRSFFEGHLLRSMHDENRKRLLAIFFLDFDKFKEVNDALGHRIGDMVLIEISARLTKSTRVSDLVARFGGDEFVILLRSFEKEAEIERFAKKIVHTFKPAMSIEKKKIQVSVSVGIAVYPLDGLKAGDLLHHADVALYHSKKNGGNRYTFYDDIKNLKKDRRVSKKP